MKTKITILLTALLMLFGISVNAQVKNQTPKRAETTTPIKGDVNEDGVVDVADINAIIEIMKNGGGTSGGTKYYWYVGQENPANMTSISPMASGTTDPGWRLIGTEVGTYTMNSPLWDGAANKITVGTSRATTYVALPNATLKVRDGDGDVLDGYTSNGTKEINGVNYYIYLVPNLKIFNGIIF